MPGGDRTGPAGMGPMTGRGAGSCAGNPAHGFVNPMWGRGGVRGFGRGGGGGGGRWRHRNWYHATGLPGWQRAWMAGPANVPPVPAPFGPVTTREQELKALETQVKYFEQALEELRHRIREVESFAEGPKTA